MECESRVDGKEVIVEVRWIAVMKELDKRLRSGLLCQVSCAVSLADGFASASKDEGRAEDAGDSFGSVGADATVGGGAAFV